ncbi:hypothetical protein SAMN06265221_13511 [Paracoccus laeviglucosivorans]|uniref:Uncharacterized protein n=1 Tax=Paracoccus laeviglucosivorans TaxID=1197861 RepID=A0A521FQW0_9RHOB|nr:hypothetical protein SAMN06265221_13511 [Paracoccus laeviglucosivorans]
MLRISITFEDKIDLNAAVRRGMETAILTLAEAETAVWIDRRLTYRTTREPEEVLKDWALHSYARQDFAQLQIAPWVARCPSPAWKGKERRIHSLSS